MLPIQRAVVSGAYVACWATVGVPLGSRISYQRKPDWAPLPGCTDWVTTSDSWSPKLRYARRCINRSASESSFVVVPGWVMHAPPLHAGVNGATEMVTGPVKVEFAGVVKSTWKRQ